MAKFGPFYSYWSKDWEVDVYDVVDKVNAVGGDALEIHLDKFDGWSDDELRRFSDYAAEKQVEFVCGAGLPAEGISYSEDPKVRQIGIDFVVDSLKTAKKLGINLLDGSFLAPWPDKPKGVLIDKRPLLERGINNLREITKVAEDLGIIMTQEIFNRFEGFLINTVKEAVDMVKAVGSPNLFINFDTFHMNIEEDSIEQAIKDGEGYIRHVHLGEANRKLPGQGGQIDWDKVFKGLKNVGYDGMFIFEAFILAHGTVSVPVSLYRDLSDGANQEMLSARLKEAIAFVKSKFES